MQEKGAYVFQVCLFNTDVAVFVFSLFASQPFAKGKLLCYVWGTVLAGAPARDAEKKVAKGELSRLISIRAFTDEVIISHLEFQSYESY